MAGAVEEATSRDLGAMPKALGESALAAAALELARGLDGDNSLTSKSMAAKAHKEIMDRLRELAPPEEKKDGIDRLADKRRKRRAGGTKTANLPRS